MKNQKFATAVKFTLGVLLAGCGAKDGGTAVPSVSGSMRFVLGGKGARSSAHAAGTARPAAGSEYIVSPSKAKITFTSVVYRDAAGGTIATSDLTSCVVTYDRSLARGATLLDCPFTMPVGDIAQIAVYFDKTLQFLVSDPVGVYTDPASSTGFSTTAPTGGAAFVPYKITIGDGTSRATPIIFSAPITIAAGTTPTLFITTDMIHTMQLNVGTGGSLTPSVSNDPVALFGGLTAGSSSLYSEATTTESIPVMGTKEIRVFSDSDGKPVFLMMGYVACGGDGPKGAWASPPIGATVGGWLGKDTGNIISWASPKDTAYSTYLAYFNMAELTTVGGATTDLKCMAAATPPAPMDGKTYASGAPALPAPTDHTTLNLLAK